MARIYTAVGYSETIEEPRGVWKETITERPYRGDLIRNTRRLQGGEGVNDNVTVSNEISIVSDPYALRNFHSIRYVLFMGTRWKVTNVSVDYPRLTLSIGDVWNGQVPEVP